MSDRCGDCVFKAFKNETVSQNWKNEMIVPLYREKGEKGERKNYRSNGLLCRGEGVKKNSDRLCKEGNR